MTHTRRHPALEAEMPSPYYDAVDRMERMGVGDEYIQGWEAGYIGMPLREEQRLTEAYEAGYADGKVRSTTNIANWVSVSRIVKEKPMTNPYYEAVDQMEKMGVEDEYIQGWEAGYIGMPLREEQRLTEAYEAGYADGKAKSAANFASWVKK